MFVAHNLAQISFDPEISDDKCLTKFEEFIRFKMKSRSGSPLEVCDGRNFRWESAIRAGDPQTEIEKFCTEYRIDLVVFGRHLTVHTKPFGLGKLPCKTMLNLKIPVMIFPPKPEDKELDLACFPVGL